MLLEEVDGVVDWLLLIWTDDGVEDEEALHWAVRSTVTVTVTGPAQVEEAVVAVAVQPAALVVVAVLQEAQMLLPPLSWPRSSTFCLAARGIAAANPKREETIMIERMAMRTCEDLSGENRSMKDVVVLKL